MQYPLDLVQAGIHNVRERHTGTVDHFGDQRGDYFTPAHGEKGVAPIADMVSIKIWLGITRIFLQVFFTIDGLTRSQQVLLPQE